MRVSPASGVALLAALSAACALCACGAGARDPVVVRVGESAITRATVSHWMTLMAPERFVPDPPRFSACIAHQQALAPNAVSADLKEECSQQYRALEQKVLGFLISSRWLTGEAAEENVAASAQQVRRRAEQDRRAEEATGVALWGYTEADLMLKARAELAAARIRQALAAREPRVTGAEVAAYYRRHTRRYERRERRYFAIVEQIGSEAAARKLMREVAQRPSKLSNIANYEFLEWPHIGDPRPTKRVIKRAIFAARPHTLVGPLPLLGRYCFFEVTYVLPRIVKSLAQVRTTIERQLAHTRLRRALTSFVAGWRRRWVAKTGCAPGYVVQKCRQYAGPRAREDPLALD